MIRMLVMGRWVCGLEVVGIACHSFPGVLLMWNACIGDCYWDSREMEYARSALGKAEPVFLVGIECRLEDGEGEGAELLEGFCWCYANRVCHIAVKVRHVAGHPVEVCRLTTHPAEMRRLTVESHRLAADPGEVRHLAGHPVEVCRAAGHPVEMRHLAAHLVESRRLTVEVCRLSVEMRHLAEHLADFAVKQGSSCLYSLGTASMYCFFLFAFTRQLESPFTCHQVVSNRSLQATSLQSSAAATPNGRVRIGEDEGVPERKVYTQSLQ